MAADFLDDKMQEAPDAFLRVCQIIGGRRRPLTTKRSFSR
jgi:hypothetical protein